MYKIIIYNVMIHCISLKCSWRDTKVTKKSTIVNYFVYIEWTKNIIINKTTNHILIPDKIIEFIPPKIINILYLNKNN